MVFPTTGGRGCKGCNMLILQETFSIDSQNRKTINWSRTGITYSIQPEKWQCHNTPPFLNSTKSSQPTHNYSTSKSLKPYTSTLPSPSLPHHKSPSTCNSQTSPITTHNAVNVVLDAIFCVHHRCKNFQRCNTDLKIIAPVNRRPYPLSGAFARLSLFTNAPNEDPKVF